MITLISPVFLSSSYFTLLPFPISTTCRIHPYFIRIQVKFQNKDLFSKNLAMSFYNISEEQEKKTKDKHIRRLIFGNPQQKFPQCQICSNLYRKKCRTQLFNLLSISCQKPIFGHLFNFLFATNPHPHCENESIASVSVSIQHLRNIHMAVQISRHIISTHHIHEYPNSQVKHSRSYTILSLKLYG